MSRTLSDRPLTHAQHLRAHDIFLLHGISPSSLSTYATALPEPRRPLSRFIRGRGGRKGVRLFPRAAFEAWLDCHAVDGTFDEARWARIRSAHTAAGATPSAPAVAA